MMTDICLIGFLTLIGLLFFAIEVFLIPDIGLAGIAAGGSLLYAIYPAFQALGTGGGWLTLAVTAAGIIGLTIAFLRSKTVDRLSLKTSIDYRPDPLKDTGLKVGDTGTALTRLTLIGNADFAGRRVEVKSDSGFIDEQTPVRICRIDGNTVFVRPANE